MRQSRYALGTQLERLWVSIDGEAIYGSSASTILPCMNDGEALRDFELRDLRRARWANTRMHTCVSVGLTSGVVSLILVIQIVSMEIPTPYLIDELMAFIAMGVLSHSLGVLGHECYHDSFFRSANANRILGAWLFHYPLLGRFELLKDIHLRHHRFFGTDRDPDIDHWGWQPGDSRHMLHIFKLLTGISFVGNVFKTLRKSPVESRVTDSNVFLERGRSDLLGVLVTQLGIMVLFTGLLSFERYVFLWILPVVTIGATVEHLRVFAEHNGGKLRIFIAPSVVELLVFSRANFRLHALHHQAPSVPWFALGSKYSTVKARLGKSLEESPSYFAEIWRIG